MYDSPYQPPTTQIESAGTLKTIRFSSFIWGIRKWDFWLVAALIAFFCVLTASGVETEMERRGAPAQYPMARSVLINHGLLVAVGVSAATVPFTIILLCFARLGYTRLIRHSRAQSTNSRESADACESSG